MKALFSAQCYNKNSTYLDLCKFKIADNDIDGDAIEILNECLTSNVTLKFLSLADNDLGSENFIQYFESISKNNGLEHIVLSILKKARQNLMIN